MRSFVYHSLVLAPRFVRGREDRNARIDSWRLVRPENGRTSALYYYYYQHDHLHCVVVVLLVVLVVVLHAGDVALEAPRADCYACSCSGSFVDVHQKIPRTCRPQQSTAQQAELLY